MLEIKEITNKKNWENFLRRASYELPPFFQTWNWGEVQKALGVEIWRLGVFENKKLIGVASVAYVQAKRGNFLHLRHGPVFLKYKKDYVLHLMHFLSEKGKKRGISFIRISPLVSQEVSDKSFPQEAFRNAQIHRMDAEDCWVLPLSGSEEDILRGMRKSHRYLIKKSQSSGVIIERTKKISKMNLLIPLYKKLAQRKHFVAHHGLKEEFEIFSKDDESLLFLAYFEKKVIAGALIDFVGNTAIYRHSASDESYKHVPAMYLLQWEVIKEAKKRGMEYYNFWGIAPKDNPRHPWQGITLFKTGFGGERREFAHAKDHIVSPRYWVIFVLEFITKLKKGY